MIKLVNGHEVEYHEDFDVFFQNLLNAIITQSKKVPQDDSHISETTSNSELFIQQVMDNCIYVTHQIFELYKEDEKMTKFIITGFLFNSVILLAPKNKNFMPQKDNDDSGTIH